MQSAPCCKQCGFIVATSTIITQFEGYSKVQCGCNQSFLQCQNCGKRFSARRHRVIKHHVTGCVSQTKVHEEIGLTQVHQENELTSHVHDSTENEWLFASQDDFEQMDPWVESDLNTSGENPLTLFGYE